MTLAAEMLRLNPSSIGFGREELAACIEACFDCVQACTACADACLGEDNVAVLRRCISTNLGCADVCASTGRILSRQFEYDAGLTRAMLEACRQCAEECERHAQHHEHCRVCAEACRRCEAACDALLTA